jgi:hypothetical protein
MSEIRFEQTMQMRLVEHNGGLGPTPLAFRPTALAIPSRSIFKTGSQAWLLTQNRQKGVVDFVF